MMINIPITKVRVPCVICGNEYEELVIGGHLDHCHICEECFRELMAEFKNCGTNGVDE